MAETKSRRDQNGLRPRPRPHPDDAGDDAPDQPSVAAPTAPPVGPAPPPPAPAEEFTQGFDAWTYSRYEVSRRGGTYITELQLMTMAQLLKTAKDEGLDKEVYGGLKKQDLIFKILKERVRQNGLMFGEGTLEILP